MKIYKKIKQKLGLCNLCWRRAQYHFELEEYFKKGNKEFLFSGRVRTIKFQYCYKHAETSGFCLGCGYFLAGTEAFDSSTIKGYCQECIDEINYDLGVPDPNEEYDPEYIPEY
ncbi:MAG: hypothetical protein A2V66_15580 [Ignavibacteria bacterium RBG_13_36_8]|nr:MAG: hypothetical protein A2V66_15580 [Ignavibacteria bacterium RBG_13_36_8]